MTTQSQPVKEKEGSDIAFLSYCLSSKNTLNNELLNHQISEISKCLSDAYSDCDDRSYLNDFLTDCL